MQKNVLVMVSPMSAARVNGIARYAREHGWHLMIQDRLGYRPLAWNGDGVVATLRSDPVTFSAVMELRRRGIPVVDLTFNRPEVRLPRVTSDHRAIGRLAAEHFAERNFKNVVWFSTGWGNVHALRFAGLSSAGPADRWVVSEALPKSRQNDWSEYSAWLGRKLADAPKPIAALTYDEADAARLLDAAERAGVAVPEELAILSIGNDPIICENQSVPLSSVDQDLDRGGYEAAAVLDALMRGEKPPSKPALIPPKGVVLRRSTDVIAAADPLVRRALDYIADNMHRRFGASQIAAALSVSRSVLDKRFSAEIGRSIGAEISRRRFAIAKIMLRNSKATISQIAAATGFCTPSHLSNAFRAATGTTPRAWRLAKDAKI